MKSGPPSPGDPFPLDMAGPQVPQPRQAAASCDWAYKCILRRRICHDPPSNLRGNRANALSGTKDPRAHPRTSVRTGARAAALPRRGDGTTSAGFEHPSEDQKVHPRPVLRCRRSDIAGPRPGRGSSALTGPGQTAQRVPVMERRSRPGPTDSAGTRDTAACVSSSGLPQNCGLTLT